MSKKVSDISTLSFAICRSTHELYNRKGFKKQPVVHETYRTDILVNDSSVLELFCVPDEVGMTTIASDYFVGSGIEELCLQLTGGFSKPELPTGIIPIYICKECGDYGCGVFGWKIDVHDSTVVWHGFAYDDNLGRVDNDEENERDEEWRKRTIIFDRKLYIDAIEALRAEFKQ